MTPMEVSVRDAAYVLITLLFFAAMIWYVGGCKRLGDGVTGHALNDAGRGPANGRRKPGGN